MKIPPLPRPSRRQALALAPGLAGFALASLLQRGFAPASLQARELGTDFPAKAKRAIWLFMAGGPSQLDLFDYKPGLSQRFNQDLPASIKERRLSTMTSGQARFPIAPSLFKFAQYGQAGTWVSELLPYLAQAVDDIALIRTVRADAVNHDPAIMAMLTGDSLPGKPSVGAWLSYGLGALNQNLPTFVVLTSNCSQQASVQPLSSSMWGNAFLPATSSGVSVRSVGAPVLFLDNPAGLDAAARRSFLDTTKALNEHALARTGEASIQARIDEFELAFRMQSAVPELTDLTAETATSKALYGPQVDVPGSFANQCLLARRMLERDVRFVQILHRGWDSHEHLPERHRSQALEIDQACFGLLRDLKQRGLLDDTLVIWGGEFGRTVFSQGNLEATDYGRDHHPGCFSMWLAGGGIKPGVVHGETDEFSFEVARDPVPLRDLHATLLHQFGLDHNQLAVLNQGLLQKLVGVDAPARVVSDIVG